MFQKLWRRLRRRKSRGMIFAGKPGVGKTFTQRISDEGFQLASNPDPSTRINLPLSMMWELARKAASEGVKPVILVEGEELFQPETSHDSDTPE